jgi:hypothetical protein
VWPDPDVSRRREQFSSHEEAILVALHRVGLHLDHPPTRQRKDALKAHRLERWQREKEVHRSVLPSEPSVDEAAIGAIPHALLSRLEREAPPDERSRRQEALEQHVRAQVHVVMAVQSVGDGTIEPMKLLELCAHEGLKAPGEPRMEHDLCEAVPQEPTSHAMLLVAEPSRTVSFT